MITSLSIQGCATQGVDIALLPTQWSSATPLGNGYYLIKGYFDRDAVNGASAYCRDRGMNYAVKSISSASQGVNASLIFYCIPNNTSDVSSDSSDLNSQLTLLYKKSLELCRLSEYQDVLAKIPCEVKDIKPNNLTDDEKPSLAQIGVLDRLFRLTQYIDATYVEIVYKLGNSSQKRNAEIFYRNGVKIREINQEILNGKMSWGEYNTKRYRLSEELKREIDSVNK